MNATGRHAGHPEVIASTTGLVSFLREVVQNGTQRLRDSRDRSREYWWLSEVPEGVRRPAERLDGVLFRLDYVPPVAAPELPEVLVGWVDPVRLADPEGGDPPLAEEGPVRERVRDEFGRAMWEERTSAQVDAGDVLHAYGAWLARWRRWAERETGDRPRRERYEALYGWHQQLAQHDDQRELVLAVGLLSWVDAHGEAVYRHLVTRRVEIAVERRTARLTVRLAPDTALRVEDQDFLDSDDGWDPERAAAVGEDLAARSPHPLSEAVLEHLVQWQERALSRPVAFSAEWAPPTDIEPGARLTYAPALVLRPRDRNALLRCYEQIAAGLATDGHAPLGLAQLVMTLDDDDRKRWSSVQNAPLLGDDPLFPLKTNAQQRSVLHRLERSSGVVVQGPPGTGKTHTIANLVAALLAQGKRVLVTSARDQPLTVLRDKLPPHVRDLCILMLSSTRQDGASELERTINALTDQVAVSDVSHLQDDIARLSTQRDGLRARISSLSDQVVELREAEIQPHDDVAAGYSGTLAVIVEQVQRNADQFGWIGALPEGSRTGPPLTGLEAQELLALLREGALEPRADGWLPAPGDVPSVGLVAETLAAGSVADGDLSEATVSIRDSLARLTETVTDELAVLVEQCRTALHHLGLPSSPTDWPAHSWSAAALQDRLARRKAFLWKRVAQVSGELDVARRSLDAAGMRHVSVPADVSPEAAGRMAQSARDLRAFLERGGRLRSRWPGKEQKAAHDILTRCTVDGQPPAEESSLDALIAHLQAHATVSMVVARWEQAGVRLTPEPPEVAIAMLAEHYEHLSFVRAFGEGRERIDALLVSHGVHVPLTTPQQWLEFCQALAALADRRAADDAHRRLDAWEQRLRAPVGDTPPAAEVVALAGALNSADVEQYAAQLQILARAHEHDARFRRCSSLLEALKQAHPSLAIHLGADPSSPHWDTRLALLGEAWAWATAAGFARRRRTPGLEQRLDAELTEHEQRLEQVTGELAGALGRLHCLNRMTQDQRSSLQAYRTHTASYGRGKGRRAAHFKAAAREAMSVAMEAVPAWVMPIGQVAEMVRMQRDTFDVIIVDEASQAGMESLFLMWLAPRVIVVGDDKQCAPSVTSLGRLQVIEDRLTAHLPEIPVRLRELYTPHTNLYQLLSTFFPLVIRLNEHFRSMPEIISWSSRTFYDGKLIPLRQFGGERPEPLVTHFVDEALTEGRDGRLRNPKEAQALVDHLVGMVEDPAYRGMTIGVIVLQGQGQVRLLDDMIKQRIDAPTRERHAIRVGNAASFQGDERHVILLSMVVTNPPRVAGGHRSEQQAYNVAASRAQDQMHLFYSVPRTKLKSNDLRLNLLTFMENAPAALAADDDLKTVLPDVPTPPFESLFEQQVYLHIKKRGYHVVPQFPAGDKRIDLVVIGARSRLAVECDGDHFHSTPEQIRHDQRRERELQRVGWEFWRVRESEFRFDPEAALTGLWTELDRNNIHPATFGLTPKPSGTGQVWTPMDLPEATDDTDDDVEGMEDTADDIDPPDTTSTEGAA
ncbi:AAA domain-containing protein [Actinacidiphila sp. bgisy160]|uniref:AAA domain-containing protein n=1 Tax=Actinacidiphila sp. bgisy160 TaxID=3413796 RepID=UPI003D73AA80